MNKTTLVFLNLSLFLFSFLNLTAQTNEEEQQSLVTFLKQVELQYNVQFSYADINVEGKVIEPPTKTASLEDILKFLERKTDLSFERLNKTIIAITKGKQSNSNSFRTQLLEEVVISNYLTNRKLY